MGNVPMTRPDLALAIHDTRYFHDSTFAGLDGDRLLDCAYGRFSVSEDGGETWETEQSGGRHEPKAKGAAAELGLRRQGTGRQSFPAPGIRASQTVRGL